MQSERDENLTEYLTKIIGVEDYDYLLRIAVECTQGNIYGWPLIDLIRECVDDDNYNLEASAKEIPRFYANLKEFYTSHKYCPRCKDFKPHSEFHKEGDRLTSYCKECKIAYKKEKGYASKYYQNEKHRWTIYVANSKWHHDVEKKREYHKNYYQTHKKLKAS